MNSFCPEGGLQNPRCVTLETFEFASEEQIFDILLDVFKSTLPDKLALVKDCENKPMRIAEEAISLLPVQGTHRLSLLLNPLGDVPRYPESPIYREVDYNFELFLSVTNKNPDCVTWELLRFKNVIEAILIGAQFAIDGYNSVSLDPKGFTYFLITGPDNNVYRRDGAYRFTVTVTQYIN